MNNAQRCSHTSKAKRWMAELSITVSGFGPQRPRRRVSWILYNGAYTTRSSGKWESSPFTVPGLGARIQAGTRVQNAGCDRLHTDSGLRVGAAARARPELGIVAAMEGKTGWAPNELAAFVWPGQPGSTMARAGIYRTYPPSGRLLVRRRRILSDRKDAREVFRKKHGHASGLDLPAGC